MSQQNMPMCSMPQSYFFFFLSFKFLQRRRICTQGRVWPIAEWKSRDGASADDYMEGAQLGSHGPGLWMPLPLP